MSETTAETRDGWRFPRLRTGELVGETLRMTLAAAPRVWPVWLVWLGAIVGMLFASRAAVPLGLPSFVTPVAITAGGSLVQAVMAGFCIRANLGVREGLWRLDRAFAAYVAIATGLIFVGNVAPTLLRLALTPSRDLVRSMVAGYGAIALFWLLMWPLTRLLLWPVGRLMGDARGRPGFSWRAMRGAVLAYLGAYLLLNAAPYILQIYARPPFAPAVDAVMVGVPAVSLTLIAILTCGLRAAAYRTRLGPGAEELRDVFA